jgi:hypothetical protein
MTAMKIPAACALLALALASAAEAQQTTDYVFITVQPQNRVDVHRPNGTLVTQLSGAATFNFNLPYDVVGVPSLRRVFVSNNGAPHVTVIDSDSLQWVQNIPVGGTQLSGMSLSPDENWIYVAGRDGNGPRVWGIHVPSLSIPVPAGFGVNDPANTAFDCCIVPASATGGSGGGPGKVYFSVGPAGAPGYIGVINVLGGGSFSSISMRFLDAVGPPTIDTQDVDTPGNMERTPDGRAVFVGCAKFVAGALDNHARVIKIDAATNNTTRPNITAASPIQNLAHTVFDVAIRLDGTSTRVFCLAVIDAGTVQVYELDETGTPQVVGAGLPAGGAGPPSPANTLRYLDRLQRLYVGGFQATTNSYSAMNAAGTPVTTVGNFSTGQATPTNFAVMATPVAVIDEVIPKAGSGAVPQTVRIRGSGFQQAGTTVLAGGAGVPFTFVDSTTIDAVIPAGAAANLDFNVNSPNLANGALDAYYVRYAAPPATPPLTLVAPSRFMGYRLLSTPQYATVAELRQGIEATFGGYNPSIYRVFFRNGASYVELNQVADPATEIGGRSFWMLSRFGGSFSVAGPDVDANAASGTDLRAIALAPGWNMVSQPFLIGAGQIPWAQVNVTSDETDFTGAVGVTTIPGQAMVSDAMEWTGTSYVIADPLVAGRGYWVLNRLTQFVYLVFDPALVTKPGQVLPETWKPLGPSDPVPPAPPSGMGDDSGGSSGGCGLLGPELLLLAFLFRRPRRKVGA